MRNRRPLLAAGSVLVASVMVTVMPPAEAAPPRTVVGSASIALPTRAQVTPEEKHALEVRKQFGLDPSLELIHQLAGTAGTGLLGIPLSPREVAEMQRREGVGESLAALDGLMQRLQPGHYGGSWLDQAGGGTAVVASTNPSSVPIDRLQALLPAGSALDLRQVALSKADLDNLASRITDDQDTLGQGLDVASVGTFLMENQVRVYLAKGSSQEDVAAVVQRYGSRGLSVAVLPDGAAPAVSRYQTSGLLYGGSRIVVGASSTSTSGYVCTSTLGSSNTCGNSGIFADASRVMYVHGVTGDTPNLPAQ